MNNKVVAAIGKMNFEGNIIPMAWFSHLTLENGKPNVIAIICLSEVIYWYRPVEIRDETSGKVVGYRKKFKADKWQCHYQAMADRFGFTKDQVRNALHFLRAKGCITLEFRHFTVETKTPLSNVLFIEPVPARIAEITTPHLGTETDMGDHLGTGTDTISAQKPTHIGTGTETYTETPTEIPTEIPMEGAARKNAPPPPDYLNHIFEAATNPQSAGIADPTRDPEAWLQYRDEALAAYKDLTGLYPDNQVGKPAISNLAGEQGFDLERWRQSVSSCRLAGVNPRNIQCMIDTYRSGGDYRAMLAKRGENGGKNGHKIEREDTGDAVHGAGSSLTPEQRALVRRYRQPGR